MIPQYTERLIKRIQKDYPISNNANHNDIIRLVHEDLPRLIPAAKRSEALLRDGLSLHSEKSRTIAEDAWIHDVEVFLNE